MTIRSLCYLGIEVPDVSLWKELGPEVFGFGVTESSDGLYLRTDSRHHRVALTHGDSPSLSYIGWEVPGPSELRALAQRIDAAGLTAETVPDAVTAERRMTEVIAVTDPHGFRHEIGYGPKEQSSFVPARGDGFIGEEDGLGHVVLVIPELSQAYRDFLTGVLGFTVYYDSTYHGMQVLFVRCNPRTHCLAALTVPGMKGLDHFFVEARNLRDVGIAHDKATDRGLEMAMTLGSHRLDPGVSFYLRTPSGFNVELGSDMIRVDGTEEPVMEEVWGHRMVGSPLGPAIAPVG